MSDANFRDDRWRRFSVAKSQILGFSIMISPSTLQLQHSVESCLTSFFLHQGKFPGHHIFGSSSRLQPRPHSDRHENTAKDAVPCKGVPFGVTGEIRRACFLTRWSLSLERTAGGHSCDIRLCCF